MYCSFCRIRARILPSVIASGGAVQRELLTSDFLLRLVAVGLALVKGI